MQLVIDEATLVLPHAEVIDVAAETRRLKKQVEKLSGEINKLEAKLANAGFTAKAPAHVIEEQAVRKAEAMAARKRLESALARLSAT